MKKILLLLLLLPILATSQTTGGKKNIYILDAVDVLGRDLDSTYRRFIHIKVLPSKNKVKFNIGWYLSKAGAINTASDVNMQIDESIDNTLKWNITDLFGIDSLAIDTAIDTLMYKYTGKLEDKYGTLNYDYDVYGFTILDSVSFKNRVLDSVYVVCRKIEMFNNDNTLATFKWYMSKDGYLNGERAVNTEYYEKRRTISEFKKPTQDWMQEYRSYMKTLEGFPSINAGYDLQAW